MASNKNDKHTNTIVLFILSALFVIGLFIWAKYKYNLADRKIPELVAQKSKGLYSIQYGDMLIDEVNGRLLVNNVRLIPDTAVFNELKKQHKQPNITIGLNIPLLRIVGVKTPKALLTKEIDGSKLEIDNPLIEIGISDFLKDTSEYNPVKEIYKQILGNLKSIKVDSIAIRHANVDVKDIRTGKIKFSGKDVSFTLTGLLVDSAQHNDSSRILFSKNLDLVCKEIVLPSKDKKYKMRFEDIEFISQSNRFTVRKIAVTPELSEELFAKEAKIQKDRYDFNFENLSLVNIRRQSLWHKRIEADSLIIEKSSFKVYRDRSYPHDSISRVGAYPHQQIMEIPFPFDVRKIVFTHSFIEYKEKNDISDSSGKLQFFNVQAVMTNMTNMSSSIARNNICQLDFNARFLNMAPITAKLIMYLSHEKGKFSIAGDMGYMPGKRLNPMIEPMALARIEKGDISKLKFNFDGGDYQSNGKLLILYHDIRLTLLKKNDAKNKYRKKILPSLAANIIMKNSNPSDHSKSEEVKWVNVHYDRDIHKSFFNLLWKSIFAGIKQTAGISK